MMEERKNRSKLGFIMPLYDKETTFKEIRKLERGFELICTDIILYEDKNAQVVVLNGPLWRVWLLIATVFKSGEFRVELCDGLLCIFPNEMYRD